MILRQVLFYAAIVTLTTLAAVSIMSFVEGRLDAVGEQFQETLK